MKLSKKYYSLVKHLDLEWIVHTTTFKKNLWLVFRLQCVTVEPCWCGLGGVPVKRTDVVASGRGLAPDFTLRFLLYSVWSELVHGARFIEMTSTGHIWILFSALCVLHRTLLMSSSGKVEELFLEDHNLAFVVCSPCVERWLKYPYLRIHILLTNCT